MSVNCLFSDSLPALYHRGLNLTYNISSGSIAGLRINKQDLSNERNWRNKVRCEERETFSLLQEASLTIAALPCRDLVPTRPSLWGEPPLDSLGSWVLVILSPPLVSPSLKLTAASYYGKSPILTILIQFLKFLLLNYLTWTLFS